MKNLCICLVVAMEVVIVSRYVYQVYKREIVPALSTWIIFFLGSGLSLATYAVAEDRDFRSGILNVVDSVGTTIILSTVFIWGKRSMRFMPFEKWYLGGIATIMAYGFLSGDAWRSNVFTQVILAIGYAPTVQGLFVKKRNTESFSVWICIVVAGVIALCPAIIDGNALAVLYAGRNIVLVSALLVVMTYYELKERRKP